MALEHKFQRGSALLLQFESIKNLEGCHKIKKTNKKTVHFYEILHKHKKYLMSSMEAFEWVKVNVQDRRKSNIRDNIWKLGYK